MATRRKRTPAKAKAAPVVYVGPTLPGGVLRHLTVFRGDGFPPHIAEIVENSPAVRGLIVPASQVADAVQAVKIKGHILNTFARELTCRGG